MADTYVSPYETIQNLQQTYSTDAASVKADALSSHLPTSSEVALINPLNTSIVKVRDNGMIDIFVDGDNGVRIDPATKTINLTASGFKDHGGYRQSWFTSWMTEVDQDWTVNTGGNINITAKGDVNLSANGTMTLQAPGGIVVDGPMTNKTT